MNVLVTGAAGFIGFHLCKALIKKNYNVFGFDNLNNYYDVNLKLARLALLKGRNFTFIKGDLQNNQDIKSVFNKSQPNIVINLGAQAGVRYSITNPESYIESNIVGFGNIIEASKNYKVEHLLYASSSSVYGGNKQIPFDEDCNVDHPLSIYAASKKANELIAHTYSHLYELPTTGLRFFTVYGPWGRPDMALFLFTKAILENKPIKIFNNGDMIRDFTYIDDIIASILKLIPKKPTKNDDFDFKKLRPSNSWAPYKIFNIGNSSPVNLMKYIETIENILNMNAIKEFLPMQEGDVRATEANTKSLEDWIDYRPSTSIESGVRSFISWYREFYNV